MTFSESYDGFLLTNFGLNQWQISALAKHADQTYFRSIHPWKRRKQLAEIWTQSREEFVEIVSKIIIDSEYVSFHFERFNLEASAFLEPKNWVSDADKVKIRLGANSWPGQPPNSPTQILRYLDLEQRYGPAVVRSEEHSIKWLAELHPSQFAKIVDEMTKNWNSYRDWLEQFTVEEHFADRARLFELVKARLGLDEIRFRYLIFIERNQPELIREDADFDDAFSSYIDEMKSSENNFVWQIQRLLVKNRLAIVFADDSANQESEGTFAFVADTARQANEDRASYFSFLVKRRLHSLGYPQQGIVEHFISHPLYWPVEATKSYAAIRAFNHLNLIEFISKVHSINGEINQQSFERYKRHFLDLAYGVSRNAYIRTGEIHESRNRKIIGIQSQSEIRIFLDGNNDKWIQNNSSFPMQSFFKIMEDRGFPSSTMFVDALDLQFSLVKVDMSKLLHDYVFMGLEPDWHKLGVYRTWLNDIEPLAHLGEVEEFADFVLRNLIDKSWSDLKYVLKTFGSRLVLDPFGGETEARQLDLILGMLAKDCHLFVRTAQKLLSIDFRSPNPWEARSNFQHETSLTKSAFLTNKKHLLDILENELPSWDLDKFFMECETRRKEISLFTVESLPEDSRELRDHLLVSAFNAKTEIQRIMSYLQKLS